MKLIHVNGWLGSLMYPLLEFIAQQQPDFVCMQEVLSSDQSSKLYPNYRLHQEVLQAGNFAYNFFAPTYSFYSLGDKVSLGNAIYSKFPLSDQETTFVSGAYNDNQVNKNFTTNIRNLLTAKVNTPEGSFWLATHHGFHDMNPLGAPETLACSQRAADAIQALPGTEPTIFCGDLNITIDGPAYEPYRSLGMRNLTEEHHTPTTLGPLHRAPQRQKDSVACDHVLISPGIKLVSFQVSEALVSDHKAIVTEFELAA